MPRTRWWIDAVCINQEDVLEHNAQISTMHRIFKKAESVSIWLGEEADDSSLAPDTILKLSRFRQELQERLNSICLQSRLMRSSVVGRPRGHFCQRPWFERAWVQQEVALSESQMPFRPFKKGRPDSKPSLSGDDVPPATATQLCFERAAIQKALEDCGVINKTGHKI